LLLEPSRTNLVTYSEDFSNSPYDYSLGISRTSNQTVSPDGYINADLITEDSTNGVHRIGISSNIGLSDLTTTMSVFAKANGRNWICLTNSNMAPSGVTYFNIAEGYIGSQSAIDAKIIDYGNGWYRCSITYLQNRTNPYPTILIANANNSTSYQGDGVSGVYLYGYQIEQNASYATSYIPTSGAAVTRAADAASQTPPSGVIGQSEGTLYWEVDFGVNSADEYPAIFLWNGTSTNRILIQRRGNTSKLQCQVVVAGSTQVDEIGTTTVGAGKVKIAVAYKVNDFVVYLNGAQEMIDTVGTTYSGALSQFAFANTRHDKTTEVKLYNTRLSNSELAALTSL
jgi:hypothetical protein